MGCDSTRAAEGGSHFSCGSLRAQRIDVEGVDSRDRGEFRRELCGELEPAARADLPVDRLWEQTPWQAPRAVGHPLVSEQRDARIEADIGQDVFGSVEEFAEPLEVEDHLRLNEFGSCSALAFEQSDLTVEVLRKGVDHGADGQFVWACPPLDLVYERRCREVMHMRDALDLVAVEAEDPFRTECCRADNL